MPNMNEPYAHIQGEIDRNYYDLKNTRRKIAKLESRAETIENVVENLKLALHKQVEADADRELEESV